MFKNHGTDLGHKIERYNVTIKDARKTNPGNFYESGFTLVELQEEPITKDWRTPHLMDQNADILNFHKYSIGKLFIYLNI